jgi:spore maturation protein CgeB
VFTPARIIAENHREVGYLPLAVDAELYRPVPSPEAEYRCEVVFIGNAHIRECSTYRELLSPFLGFDLAVYGSRWDSPEYREWTGAWKGVLPIDRGRDAYAGASVALSIHNRQYLSELSFVTARPYHSLACGRATVSDTSSALAELLPARESGLRHAASAQEFERAVTELLNDEPLRAELGARGREFVLQHHTWDVRMEQLLDELQGR